MSKCKNKNKNVFKKYMEEMINMNRHELIHRATELSDLIDNEPRMTVQKLSWIVEKANIECQLGIHNL